MIKNMIKKRIKKAVAELSITAFKLLRYTAKSVKITYDPRRKEWALSARVKKEWGDA